jgi:UrcA family protein
MSARVRFLLCTLLIAGATAVPVAAAQADGSSAIHVGYQDLNLSTPIGVATLYDRIRHASADYCEPARELVGTRVSPEYNRCVRDAISWTVRQIGHPGLSALHAARGGASAS